jgi:2-C-methyl-D-erythritol 4-phosphate cytidylyltransferase
MKNASVIIVAGGSGKRMGRPKQMLPINGKPVLERSIEAFLKIPQVGQIVVVTGEDIFKKISKHYKNLTHALAGETRLQSVINGVNALNPKFELVAVHDGARPLVSPKDIKAGLASAAINKAAVLAVPVKDTIKKVSGGKITETLDRSVLYAAQTPQCYRAEILKKALNKYSDLKDATDESQLVEKLGVKVAVVVSDYKNIKITTPEDIIIAEALCKKEQKRK